MNRSRIMKIGLISLSLILVIAYLFPIPYYVSKPGMAKELEPIIEVDNGTTSNGSFMLTTIQMGKANVFSIALATMMDYWEISPENEVRREQETDEEYNMRQLHMMEGSKEKAIISAYRAAGKPYETLYKGIYVYGVVKGMPAEDHLKAGDRVTKVDEQPLTSTKQFMEYIATKKIGDSLKLEVIRDKKVIHKKVSLEKLSQTGKLGIGIELIDDIEVKTTPQVSIESDQIGGPSAGLMFSLEIYNQLVEEDITKGYKIAGTGTVEGDGVVGPIGGIDQKIVAADKSGAEIFFAPNEKGKKDSNYLVAKKTAEDIKTQMKVVPVDTMEEALAYLEKLKEK